jgi:peptidyl-tRNA hydrolase
MAERYIKQVIVVRRDLSMPTGKLMAMVCHASMTFLLKRLGDHATDQFETPCWAIKCFTPDELRWLTEIEPGLEYADQLAMAKIVLQVDNLDQLLEVESKALEAGVSVYRVTDGGHSHNKPGDVVCIALGPDWPEKMTPYTGHLKIYR